MTDSDDVKDQIHRVLELFDDRILLLFMATAPMFFIMANAIHKLAASGVEPATNYTVEAAIAVIEAQMVMSLVIVDLYLSVFYTMFEFATTGMALELLVLGLVFTTAALIGLFVTDHAWAPPMVLYSLHYVWKEAKDRRI
ncbi:hypothetical protein [Saliphagus infecundisoli]|uniref:Uncharacterized protein n=1 Tax=Saliphagus infecundisoli TaxID=1849069 RepID=A0ABD5QIW8_9EURY|nr:hypothetical protein [Saliphagus infecundisoli]